MLIWAHIGCLWAIIFLITWTKSASFKSLEQRIEYLEER